MPHYNFHTHGVNTIIEFPERTAAFHYASWGTLVHQLADASTGGSNWFHYCCHVRIKASKPDRWQGLLSRAIGGCWEFKKALKLKGDRT